MAVKSDEQKQVIKKKPGKMSQLNWPTILLTLNPPLISIINFYK